MRLFACAFNLLIGYVGLASFGHAMFFGWASYLTAYAAKTGSLSIPLLVRPHDVVCDRLAAAVA